MARKILIKSSDLIWDDWNEEHIRRHSVKKEEVEEALEERVSIRKSYKRRVVAFGKTKTNRILAIVLKKTNKGYYLFSARSASKKERKSL